MSIYQPANAAIQSVCALSFLHPHAENGDNRKEDAPHPVCRMFLWTREQGFSPGPHTLTTQPARTGGRPELLWKCRTVYIHLFSVITIDVAQKPHNSPPFKLHVPRIPPFCPMEGEGARTWVWEGKADLHKKAVKAFGSSAQPGSTLSHLSCHIYSAAIMKLTLLSQRVQDEYLTEFIPQHMTRLGLSGSTATAHM